MSEIGKHNYDGYGPANPHPGHGKDPNIMNEFGHTVYPKWVKGQIAKDAKHEKEILGEEKKAAAWSESSKKD